MTTIGDTSGPRQGRATRAKAILGRFAPLAWFRTPAEFHPHFGYAQVAHLGWRFDEPHEEFKPIFEAATRNAPQNTTWTFGVQKNWLILPERLARESMRSGGDFGMAQQIITENDQDFCMATIADLELILDALDQAAPGRAGAHSVDA
ncbi:hypothetical protein AB0F18_24965 [Streptomyces sp. NPDC029216]|uniref:hypothetical protein n=1 Tax=Streptomyces sp. NPDC029216 TaxID=3154701 RepID=UPI0033E8CD1F